MEMDTRKLVLMRFVCFLCVWDCVTGLLSPKGVNYEALMTIKTSLGDPRGILDDWDANDVDPCSWTMVTCSSDYLVVSLGIPSLSLYGTLSSSIGNLTNLQTVFLQNNNISCPIPVEIGKLTKL